jgi:hypothetical protein
MPEMKMNKRRRGAIPSHLRSALIGCAIAPDSWCVLQRFRFDRCTCQLIIAYALANFK